MKTISVSCVCLNIFIGKCWAKQQTKSHRKELFIWKSLPRSLNNHSLPPLQVFQLDRSTLSKEDLTCYPISSLATSEYRSAPDLEASCHPSPLPKLMGLENCPNPLPILLSCHYHSISFVLEKIIVALSTNSAVCNVDPDLHKQ